MNILENLNPPQIKAVTTVHGPVLVLAGPGSGKTRVLTRRIAYLIEEAGIAPWNILAVTFTNKAAGEMRERVERILAEKFGPPPPGQPARLAGLTIGTFHSICARILRVETAAVGFAPNWVIYDTADQVALVRAVMRELNLDEKRHAPKAIHAHISAQKNEMVTPETYRSTSYFEEIAGRVYAHYQQALQANNAMDFDDLLLRTVMLLRDNLDVRVKYQRKWPYLLVDEFQDTNAAQYEMMRLLATEPTNNKNLFVVGDEDQCLIAGTPITTPDGERPIEELKAGDIVLSASGQGATNQRALEANLARPYHGKVLRIRTVGGREFAATPEHCVFGRFEPNGRYHYVYLMYSAKLGYRVGRTGSTRKSREREYPGFVERLRQERGDAIWLLKACETVAEAAYWESYISVRYGLPTVCFYAGNGRDLAISDELIRRLYAELDTIGAAQRLAEDLGISLSHPHHMPQSTIRNGSVRKSVTFTMFGSHRLATGGNRWHQDGQSWHLHEISICSSSNEFRTQVEPIIRTKEHKRLYWAARRSHSDYEVMERTLSGILTDVGDVRLFKRAKLTTKAFSFMPVGHLIPGAIVPVLQADGKVGEDEVLSVTIEDYDGLVYDLSVSIVHNYAAGGVIVHNSIYRFRGADYRNVRLFQRDYPEHTLVLLEQNYRSTQTILDVANSLISQNRNRTPKRLHTEAGQGLPVMVYEAYNEIEEAAFVVDEIQKLLGTRAFQPGDFAVTYRTNAQSRALEEAFVLRGMKYKLVGATRFYERKEVKDALAYLRLVHNPADSIALQRIINEPPRGIGAKTVEALYSWAAELGESPFAALLILHHGPERAAQLLGRRLPAAASQASPLGGRAQKALAEFAALLEDWIDQERAGRYQSVAELLDTILTRAGYVQALRDGTEEGEDRFENLQELRGVAAQYVAGMAGLQDEQTPLGLFLEEVSLVSDADQVDEKAGAVTLLTLHTAKGLEFPVVFIVGLEEGLLPHSRSLESGDLEDMAEERRLTYVGVTRAKRRLYLVHCFKRSLWGGSETQTPSRFLEEIPTELLTGMVDKRGRREQSYKRMTSWGDDDQDDSRQRGGSSARARGTKTPSASAYDWSKGGKPAASGTTSPAGGSRAAYWSPGGKQPAKPAATASGGRQPQFKRRDSVQHPTFGVGTVIESTLTRDDEEVTVAFPGVGIKKLLVSLANLKRL